MTALYSILHFLVDGVCAFSMFGYFAIQENWYVNILLYNFCAFAMQMPLGVVLDGLNGRRKQQKYECSFVFAVLGVALTLIGAFMHPVVLGLGNALFHLGGGVGVIHEDEANGWRGRGLGVFVAPGALGLYIGTQLVKNSITSGWAVLIPVGVFMFCCLLCGMQVLRRRDMAQRQEANAGGQAKKCRKAENDKDRKQTIPEHSANSSLWLIVGCVSVVILRSYIGMAVGFSWKTTLLAGIIAVLAVVLGKVAGGFAAAGFGASRTVVVSLGLAAVCYLFSGNIFAGVLALFFFNMTMPVTLYMLVQKLKGLPGFSFGLLTFGLFLGFLPVYLDMKLPIDGRLLGCAGSLVSMVILWLCVHKRDNKSGLQALKEAQTENMSESDTQEVS